MNSYELERGRQRFELIQTLQQALDMSIWITTNATEGLQTKHVDLVTGTTLVLWWDIHSLCNNCLWSVCIMFIIVFRGVIYSQVLYFSLTCSI